MDASQVKEGRRIVFTDKGRSNMVYAHDLAGHHGILRGHVQSGAASVLIQAPGHYMDGKRSWINISSMELCPESNEEGLSFLKQTNQW